MVEVWKSISGYGGLYKVSSYGRVCNSQKVMKLTVDKRGYFSVGLHKNGKTKTCSVHRLVAQAFLNNPDGLPEVNHKDEDKQNNSVENLEWCTRQYNCTYGNRIEKQKEALAKTLAKKGYLPKSDRKEKLREIFNEMAKNSFLSDSAIVEYEKEFDGLLNKL